MMEKEEEQQQQRLQVYYKQSITRKACLCFRCHHRHRHRLLRRANDQRVASPASPPRNTLLRLKSLPVWSLDDKTHQRSVMVCQNEDGDDDYAEQEETNGLGRSRVLNKLRSSGGGGGGAAASSNLIDSPALTSCRQEHKLASSCLKRRSPPPVVIRWRKRMRGNAPLGHSIGHHSNVSEFTSGRRETACKSVWREPCGVTIGNNNNNIMSAVAAAAASSKVNSQSRMRLNSRLPNDDQRAASFWAPTTTTTTKTTTTTSQLASSSPSSAPPCFCLSRQPKSEPKRRRRLEEQALHQSSYGSTADNPILKCASAHSIGSSFQGVRGYCRGCWKRRRVCHFQCTRLVVLNKSEIEREQERRARRRRRRRNRGVTKRRRRRIIRRSGEGVIVHSTVKKKVRVRVKLKAKREENKKAARCLDCFQQPKGGKSLDNNQGNHDGDKDRCCCCSFSSLNSSSKLAEARKKVPTGAAGCSAPVPLTLPNTSLLFLLLLFFLIAGLLADNSSISTTRSSSPTTTTPQPPAPTLTKTTTLLPLRRRNTNKSQFKSTTTEPASTTTTIARGGDADQAQAKANKSSHVNRSSRVVVVVGRCGGGGGVGLPFSSSTRTKRLEEQEEAPKNDLSEAKRSFLCSPSSLSAEQLELELEPLVLKATSTLVVVIEISRNETRKRFDSSLYDKQEEHDEASSSQAPLVLLSQNHLKFLVISSSEHLQERNRTTSKEAGNSTQLNEADREAEDEKEEEQEEKVDELKVTQTKAARQQVKGWPGNNLITLIILDTSPIIRAASERNVEEASSKVRSKKKGTNNRRKTRDTKELPVTKPPIISNTKELTPNQSTTNQQQQQHNELFPSSSTTTSSITKLGHISQGNTINTKQQAQVSWWKAIYTNSTTYQDLIELLSQFYVHTRVLEDRVQQEFQREWRAYILSKEFLDNNNNNKSYPTGGYSIIISSKSSVLLQMITMKLGADNESLMKWLREQQDRFSSLKNATIELLSEPPPPNRTINVCSDGPKILVWPNSKDFSSCLTPEQSIEKLWDELRLSTFHYPIIVLNILIFLFGTTGNVFVCLSVYKNHQLRNVTNYFIVNLAFADFLVILICLPATVVWDLSLTWFFGTIPCKLIMFLQDVSISVSVLTLAAISVDRYYAICYPLKFKTSLNQAKRMIVLIWILSIIFMAPDLIYMSAKTNQEITEAGLDTVLFSDCNYDWGERASKIFQFIKTILLYLLPFILMICAHYKIMLTLNAASNNTSKKLHSIKRQMKDQSATSLTSSINAQATGHSALQGAAHNQGGGLHSRVVNKFYQRFYAPHTFVGARQRFLQQHSNKSNTSDYELHLVSQANHAEDEVNKLDPRHHNNNELANSKLAEANFQEVAMSLPCQSGLLSPIASGGTGSSMTTRTITPNIRNDNNNNTNNPASQQPSLVGSYCSAASAATNTLMMTPSINQHNIEPRKLRFTSDDHQSNCDLLNDDSTINNSKHPAQENVQQQQQLNLPEVTSNVLSVSSNDPLATSTTTTLVQSTGDIVQETAACRSIDGTTTTKGGGAGGAGGGDGFDLRCISPESPTSLIRTFQNIRQKFASKTLFKSNFSIESTNSLSSANTISLKRASICSYQMTNDHAVIAQLRHGSIHSNQLLVTMHNKHKLDSRRAAAKMLMTIVVMFGICYLPVHLINFLRIMENIPQTDVTSTISMLSHCFCYFNSAINPIIYNHMNSIFRAEFHKFLSCFSWRRKRLRKGLEGNNNININRSNNNLSNNNNNNNNNNTNHNISINIDNTSNTNVKQTPSDATPTNLMIGSKNSTTSHRTNLTVQP